VAAFLLVQDRGDALGLPVIEHGLHVEAAVAGTLDQHGRVPDRLLLGEYLRDVLAHRRGSDLHVADRVEGESLGIGFPD